MDKITLPRINSNGIKPEKFATVWISKEINDQITAMANETSITKQRLIDYLLRKALEVTVVEESEI